MKSSLSCDRGITSLPSQVPEFWYRMLRRCLGLEVVAGRHFLEVIMQSFLGRVVREDTL